MSVEVTGCQETQRGVNMCPVLKTLYVLGVFLETHSTRALTGTAAFTDEHSNYFTVRLVDPSPEI